MSINISEYNPTETEELINNELEKINLWLKLNKLSLNVKKTKCMAFHTPRKKVTLPKIKLNNELINYVKEFNFLGIIINEPFNWKSHIDHISSKI